MPETKALVSAVVSETDIDGGGLYEEFTKLTPASYSRLPLIQTLVEELGDEFWDFVGELVPEKQDIVLQTLLANPQLITTLVKSAKEDPVTGLFRLPDKFRTGLQDLFLAGIAEVPPSDPRRILISRVFLNGKALLPEELKIFAAELTDNELERVLGTLSAKQILDFCIVLGADRLEKLPTIIKRATVLAQVKSVICADTVTDPKLKQVCNSGKWAAVRTFGVKK